ncbi:MAG: hypothetical protein M1827_006554 [Pycnora praestabilis]|nr:MAG: hypothetical protein M1827_006554 [Pycnora praestabilis]
MPRGRNGSGVFVCAVCDTRFTRPISVKHHFERTHTAEANTTPGLTWDAHISCWKHPGTGRYLNNASSHKGVQPAASTIATAPNAAPSNLSHLHPSPTAPQHVPYLAYVTSNMSSSSAQATAPQAPSATATSSNDTEDTFDYENASLRQMLEQIVRVEEELRQYEPRACGISEVIRNAFDAEMDGDDKEKGKAGNEKDERDDDEVMTALLREKIVEWLAK